LATVTKPLLPLLRRALVCLLPLAAGWWPHAAWAQDSTEGTLDAAMSERVRTALGAAIVLPSGPARVEFEIGRLDPRLRLAPCRRIEPHLPHAAPLWGRIRIGLRCTEGEKLWNVSLPVTVKVFAQALVLPAALPAGTTLAAQHLALAEVDLAADPSPAYMKPTEVLGRTLSRPLVAGSTLRAADLRQRQWFAAGDTVQVIARGDGFVVIGEGLAVSSGVEGTPAKVKTESGRILSGQPTAERRVEVSL
jgi:flagella basal body P-ring formation protein FlgA